MYFSGTVKLIQEIAGRDSLDAIGNAAVREAARAVFCDVQSSPQSEFFQAQQTGLKPAWKVRVHSFEYQGERLAELNGERYAIYRTYQTGDVTELYLEGRGGI